MNSFLGNKAAAPLSTLRRSKCRPHRNSPKPCSSQALPTTSIPPQTTTSKNSAPLHCVPEACAHWHRRHRPLLHRLRPTRRILGTPTQSLDTAAGKVIVEEAGGTVTNYAEEPYSIYDKTILATNGLIHQEMAEVLRLRESKSPS